MPERRMGAVVTLVHWAGGCDGLTFH